MSAEPLGVVQSEAADHTPVTPRDASAIRELYGRISILLNSRGSLEDDAFVWAFCAQISRMNPFLPARTIASALPARSDRPFDRVAFVNTMANLGYRYSSFRCRVSEIDRRLLPVLVLRGQDRGKLCPENPLVVGQAPDDPDGLCVLDARTLTSRSACEDEAVEVIAFSGIVEDDMPTSKTARENSRSTWFRATMKRFKPQIRQILMVGLLLNMIALSVPLLILLVHERVISIGETAPLIYLAKGVAIIVAVEYLLRRARSKLLTWITSRLDFIVGSASFDRLVNLNSSIVGRAGVSEQIARIKTFESIRDFLCGPVMVTAIEIPTALFALLLLAFLGGKIVYVALVGMVLFCGLFALVWYRVRVRIKEAAIETSRVQQFTLDCLERIEAIRLDGLSDRWEERYREISGREQIANFRLGQTGIHGEIAAQFLTGLLVIAAVYVGTNLIWVGELGAGALITCMMLLLRGLAPLHALCGMIPRLEQMRNAIAQIDQLMDIETETRYEPRALTPSNLKGEGRIGFANVTFRYPKQAQMVLSGLDFEASPGEVLAITGPNGSGKSSILKLVLGLYPPLLGAVRLDGFDIRQLDPHELREQISYVPQEIDLFAGTIAENLRLGMPLATDEDLQACLEQAGAWGSVSAQPAGMETVIDPQQIAESDPLLRERIGLARGLLRPSSVLLIDERPSSSLLAGLDGDLRSCIDRLRGKKTIIFVSYRTDMLRIADRVIALRPGGRAVIGTLDKIVGQV